MEQKNIFTNYFVTRYEAVKKFVLDHKTFFLLYLPIILLAIIARFVMIEARPVHHDEGVNGWFIQQMWNEGLYKYDPTNYHGPLHFYVLQLSEIIFGKGIFSLRFAVAIFSIASVILVLMHYKFFGRIALWAGFLMAISSGMVFYGRYAIHENMLVFSFILFSYGFFLKNFKVNEKAGLICMIAGFFIGWLSKETFFINYGVWAVAWVLVTAMNRDFPTKQFSLEMAEPLPLVKKQKKQKLKEKVGGEDPDKIEFSIMGNPISISKKNIYISLKITAVCFIISAIIYTGFLLNPKGFEDMFRSFIAWAQTGKSGQGHEKPWYYWIFTVMPPYEIVALFSILPALLLFFIGSKFARFFSVVYLGTLIAFSIIPYKTPWIEIDFIWPAFFVFGYMMEMILASKQANARIAGLLLGLGLIVWNLIQSYNINYIKYADIYKQPFIYTHTDITLMKYYQHLLDAEKLHPEHKNMQIDVASEQTWPLPYILGDWPNISWAGFNPNQEVQKADTIILDFKNKDFFEAKITEPYIVEKGMLRESYTDLLFYYRYEVFKDSWKGPMEIVKPKNKIEEVKVAE